MNNCGNCANYNTERMCHTDICGECFVTGQNGHISGKPSKWKPLPLTNGDRIRAMTDEELAAWLTSFGAICEICSDNEIVCDDQSIACGRCTDGVENWLKQPTEGRP